jgi:hypothetical protein
MDIETIAAYFLLFLIFGGIMGLAMWLVWHIEK